MEHYRVDWGVYQRLLGWLIYLSQVRPDIAYVVSVMSQFMHDSKEVHLQAIYRILQYLKGSLGMIIIFRKGTILFLEAYMNVDYVGSMVNKRSTSGYYTFLGGNLMTWRSKKTINCNEIYDTRNLWAIMA